jgi:glycosyltransferase involved in cell wall biosynthesis
MATRYIEECDIFHFLSSIGLYSARKAKAHGAKVVCDVRQEHPNFQRRILQEEQEKYGLNCMIPGVIYEEKVKQEFALSDYLIVPSSYAKKTFVAEGFDGKRIFVLPYGADLAFFYKVRRQDSVFRVLFVGKITLRKGVQYLLEAMRQLRLKHAELVLVGNVDPAMRPLLEKYRGLFRHIPSVPKVELFKYYSNASVMVLPSLADSFGLVILESMACGLPVIASEHTGAKEMFAEGVEGFVVPIRDIEALKEKILLFYENPEVRDDMGEAALRRAHQMTWYRYGQRAIEIYRSLEQADNHAYAPIKCAT